MKAYAGASGFYPIPRFRVLLEGEVEFHVHAVSVERARQAATSIYRREILSITLVDGDRPVPPTEGHV